MSKQRMWDGTETCWICGCKAGAEMVLPPATSGTTDTQIVNVCLYPACIEITNYNILLREPRANERKRLAGEMNIRLAQPELVDYRLGDTNSDTLGGDEMPDACNQALQDSGTPYVYRNPCRELGLREGTVEPTSNQESDEVYPLIPGRVPSTVPTSLEEWCRNQTPSEASELTMARQVDAIEE